MAEKRTNKITTGNSLANQEGLANIGENQAIDKAMGNVDGKTIFPTEVNAQRMSVVDGSFQGTLYSGTMLVGSGGMVVTSDPGGDGAPATGITLSSSLLSLVKSGVPMVQLDGVSGNASFTGEITATSGSFPGSLMTGYLVVGAGGIVIASSSDGTVPTTGIYIGGGQIILYKDGDMKITLDGTTGDGTFMGDILASTISAMDSVNFGTDVTVGGDLLVNGDISLRDTDTSGYLRFDGPPVGAPVAAPTSALAGLGAGNVENGLHKYKVSFYTALGETVAGIANAGTTVVDKTTNGQVALSAIPKGGTTSGVTGRRVYRTVADGSVYKLLVDIGNNTANTYTDNVADASLGAEEPATSGAGGARRIAYDADADGIIVSNSSPTGEILLQTQTETNYAGNYARIDETEIQLNANAGGSSTADMSLVIGTVAGNTFALKRGSTTVMSFNGDSNDVTFAGTVNASGLSSSSAQPIHTGVVSVTANATGEWETSSWLTGFDEYNTNLRYWVAPLDYALASYTISNIRAHYVDDQNVSVKFNVDSISGSNTIYFYVMGLPAVSFDPVGGVVIDAATPTTADAAAWESSWAAWTAVDNQQRTVYAVQIPPAVASAALVLNVLTADGAPTTVYLHRVVGTPVMGETSWNEKSTGVDWTTAGGDYDATALDSFSVTSTADTISLDFTTLAQAHLGQMIYLLLRCDTGSGATLIIGEAIDGSGISPFEFT